MQTMTRSPHGQLAWLSLAMFFGMTLWFLATAANAPIVGVPSLREPDGMADDGGAGRVRRPHADRRFGAAPGAGRAVHAARSRRHCAHHPDVARIPTDVASIVLLPIAAQAVGWRGCSSA